MRYHVAGMSRPSPAAQVVSVGYERRPIAEFLSLLKRLGVSRLLDVREAAFSRVPDYRRAALKTSLADAGIEYLHLPQAGNPYRKEKEDNLEECLRAYRRHLSRHPGVLTAVLKELTGEGAVAVLCYERHHDDCHRSVLLSALRDSGPPLQVLVVN